MDGLRQVGDGPPLSAGRGPPGALDSEPPEPCAIERVEELVLPHLRAAELLDRHDAESTPEVLPALERDHPAPEVVEPRRPALLERVNDVRLPLLDEVLLEGVDELRSVEAVSLVQRVDAVDQDQRLLREVPLHGGVCHVDLRQVRADVDHEPSLGNLALAVALVCLVALLTHLDSALALLEVRAVRSGPR